MDSIDIELCRYILRSPPQKGLLGLLRLTPPQSITSILISSYDIVFRCSRCLYSKFGGILQVLIEAE